MCTFTTMWGTPRACSLTATFATAPPPAKKYTQIINKLAAVVRPLKKHNGDAWEKQPSDDDFSFIFRRRQRSSVVCLKVKSDALRTSLVIAGP